MKTINFKISREDLATIRAQAARLVGGGRFKIEINQRIGTVRWAPGRSETSFNTEVLDDRHDHFESYAFSVFVDNARLRKIEVRPDDAEETVTLDLCVCTWSGGRYGDWEPDSYINPTFKNGKLVGMKTI